MADSGNLIWQVTLIGYIRVSKSDGSQVLDLQKDALHKAGVESSYIYEDLASGRKDDRPGLKSCLKALQSGNTLVVWKLDRLGRDMKHLVNLVDDLSTQIESLNVVPVKRINASPRDYKCGSLQIPRNILIGVLKKLI